MQKWEYIDYFYSNPLRSAIWMTTGTMAGSWWRLLQTTRIPPEKDSGFISSDQKTEFRLGHYRPGLAACLPRIVSV